MSNRIFNNKITNSKVGISIPEESKTIVYKNEMDNVETGVEVRKEADHTGEINKKNLKWWEKTWFQLITLIAGILGIVYFLIYIFQNR